MSIAYDYLFKVLLIGNSGVGKTSILMGFLNDTFNPNFVTTVGIDFKIRTINIQGKNVRLQIWDTSGQEKFRSIITAYYRGASGIFLVYDVANERSFENVELWIQSIEENLDDDVEIMLIGNKCDLTRTRQVSTIKGEQLAAKCGYKFMETSANLSINMEDSLCTLTQDMMLRMDKKWKSNPSGDKIKIDTVKVLKSEPPADSPCCPWY